MPNMNLKKLWRKKSVTITEYDPTHKVVYLGNVLTGWAKGDGCVDKPLGTLWRNYCQSSRPDIAMKVTICSSGLRAVTREHGLTEYWAHRVTYCAAHPAYPRVFCWIYRHEGRRLKQELRCHAVLCPKAEKAEAMATELRIRLVNALQEFRREKVTRQNARLSIMHAIYDSANLPRRKMLLSTGSSNYRPPLERSKSAPKLGAIEESIEEEDEEAVNSEVEEQIVEEDEPTCVFVQPTQEEDVGGSSTVSETTSDIMANYDSCSEAASLDRVVYPLEDCEMQGRGEFVGREDLFHMSFHGSDTLLYCPAPRVLSLDDPRLPSSEPISPADEVSGKGDSELTLLELTRELSLVVPPEDSLTSDQPESLGSHCDSCSSSCGGCSDRCDVIQEQDHILNEQDHITINDAHIIEKRIHKNKAARLEGDNISEESGYAEDKDSLDATKL
ncbi:unnamed protein product [Meganyctiphanes norvegica]|uniref:PID domain-containing protein n=1 Tax=Meganyctiphanes norvegica TaxID=48144 RepID=A0AAV2R4T9_MEGNR